MSTSNPSSPVFFKSLEDFTPANITTVLKPLYPDADVTDVKIADQHRGSASHIILDLSYGPNMRSPLPKRMFTKTNLDAGREALPSGFDETFANDMVTGFYFSEVRAYELLLEDEDLNVEAPKVFALARGTGASDWFIFLEDLNDRSAICPKVIPSLPVERIASLLETLAPLHAKFWESPRLKGDLSWFGSNDEGGFADFLRGPGWAPMDIEFELDYKKAILNDIGIDRAHMKEAYWRRQAALHNGPQTFLHGDTHPGNIYFLPDGGVGLLDWQLARRGPWVHDVSYAIMSALNPDDRRAHEWDLIAGYMDHLKRLGVKTLPTDDDIKLAHRQCPAWGVPMWGITPAEMYSKEEVETVVRRFATAWQDFDTSAALGL